MSIQANKSDATAAAIQDFITEYSPPESEPLTIYYDAERKEYLLENASGRWLSYNQGQIRRKLRALGHSCKTGDSFISPVEKILCDTEEHKDVYYAAPLAGKTSGFYEDNGLRYLVTDSPHFIDPVLGDWSLIEKILTGLLVTGEAGDIGNVQMKIFLGWLRHAVISLRAGTLTQAQALAICGPANSGKSLLQKIITKALGGRAGKGARYMMGKTDFNSELCSAEHIMLEDEHMSQRMPDRLHLGTQIKNVTVSSDTVSCHQKNRKAVNIPVWWRISISLNDDPEDLRVLPPLNESVQDKIIVLHASSYQMPMPTHTAEQKRAFWKSIEDQLPAFLYHIINVHEIAESDQSQRYGVRTWHHPELFESLHELSPEAHLLKMIDLVLWYGQGAEWTGTADELRAILRSHDDTRRDADRLLEHSNTTGTYLGRLAKNASTKNRLEASRKPSSREWIIRKKI